MVSAVMDTVDRMQLGPAGAALLEARIREAGHMDTALSRVQSQAHADVMRTRCKVEPRSQGIKTDQDVKPELVSLSALQSYFEKAMAKFLEEQGPTQNAPHWDASDRGHSIRDRGPTYPRSSQRGDHLGPPGATT